MPHLPVRDEASRASVLRKPRPTTFPATRAHHSPSRESAAGRRVLALGTTQGGDEGYRLVSAPTLRITGTPEENARNVMHDLPTALSPGAVDVAFHRDR
jgi:hypothetical protein